MIDPFSFKLCPSTRRRAADKSITCKSGVCVSLIGRGGTSGEWRTRKEGSSPPDEWKNGIVMGTTWSNDKYGNRLNNWAVCRRLHHHHHPPAMIVARATWPGLWTDRVFPFLSRSELIDLNVECGCSTAVDVGQIRVLKPIPHKTCEGHIKSGIGMDRRRCRRTKCDLSLIKTGSKL